MVCLRERRRGGFTLLEVLLTLAVIGLVVAVLVTGAVQLTEHKDATPEEIFWKAVGDARKQAMLSGQAVQLRLVQKGKSTSLLETGPSGEKSYEFSGATPVVVDFLSTQKTASAILIRGELVETQTIPAVTFYGDGTCSPFRLQIRGSGTPRMISIDPWTCAPVLPATPERTS